MKIQIDFSMKPVNVDGMDVIAEMMDENTPVFSNNNGDRQLLVSQEFAELYMNNDSFNKKCTELYNDTMEYISNLRIPGSVDDLQTRGFVNFDRTKENPADWLSKIGHGAYFYASMAIKADGKMDGSSLEIDSEELSKIKKSILMVEEEISEKLGYMCEDLKALYFESGGVDFGGVIIAAV